jgi:hypothetical protein
MITEAHMLGEFFEDRGGHMWNSSTIYLPISMRRERKQEYLIFRSSCVTRKKERRRRMRGWLPPAKLYHFH